MTASRRWFGLVIGASGVLLVLAYFGVEPLIATVHALRPAYAAIYLAVAVLVLCGYTLRWWIVAHSIGAGLPFARLFGARLAGDAVGFLLPGARIVGDPVRILLVRKLSGGGARAGAGVAADRLLETAGNTVAAIVYVLAVGVLSGGRFAAAKPALLGGLAVLLGGLLLPVLLLWRGQRPFGFLYPRGAPAPTSRLRVLYDAEEHLLTCVRTFPFVMLFGALLSIMIEAVIVLEYALLLRAFALDLPWPTLFLVLIASGLARAVPTPGALGSLEAGQITAVTIAGGAPETGFVIGMVIRAHELLWMSIGVFVLVVQGWTPARLRIAAVEGVQP